VKTDLVLTVTKMSDPYASVIDRKCIYNKKGVPFLLAVDQFYKQAYTLSASVDVNSSDYILASLSVQAITTAEREMGNSGAAGVVDMEGYSNPPGEIPYKGSGSVFVPSFLIKMCPKN